MSDPTSVERSATAAGTADHPVRRHAARLSGVAGLSYVVLFVLGFALVVITGELVEAPAD